MNRQEFALLVVAGAVTLVACVGADQAPKPAAPATPAAQGGQAPAARPRLSPPVRGVAQLGYTKPVVKGGKDLIVTTMRVKNMDSGAIAGLKVEELWYDKAGDLIAGDDYRHPRPLQPGEVITVTLETRRNPRMDRNQYSFTHANGTIKASLQPKL